MVSVFSPFHFPLRKCLFRSASKIFSLLPLWSLSSSSIISRNGSSFDAILCMAENHLLCEDITQHSRKLQVLRGGKNCCSNHWKTLKGYLPAFVAFTLVVGSIFPFPSFLWSTFPRSGSVSPNFALISFAKFLAWLSWRLTMDLPLKWGISIVLESWQRIFSALE